MLFCLWPEAAERASIGTDAFLGSVLPLVFLLRSCLLHASATLECKPHICQSLIRDIWLASVEVMGKLLHLEIGTQKALANSSGSSPPLWAKVVFGVPLRKYFVRRSAADV